MQSLSLLSELQKLPPAEGVAALDHDETVARIQGMDRNHFSIEVSQATEEALEALFDARNVPDVLNEAFGKAFSSVAESTSLHERYQEMMERGPGSVSSFVSNLKGKVAELKAKSILEELNPSYKFELAESPTQPGWDLMGTSPDAPDIFVQVKVGGQGYADEVVDAMQDHANFDFAVSGEVYDAIEESHPELLGRLIEIGPAAELTESVKDGLDKLASNFGVDVPDGLGDALPYVAEVVLGIRLI